MTAVEPFVHYRPDSKSLVIQLQSMVISGVRPNAPFSHFNVPTDWLLMGLPVLRPLQPSCVRSPVEPPTQFQSPTQRPSLRQAQMFLGPQDSENSRHLEPRFEREPAAQTFEHFKRRFKPAASTLGLMEALVLKREENSKRISGPAD